MATPHVCSCPSKGADSSTASITRRRTGLPWRRQTSAEALRAEDTSNQCSTGATCHPWKHSRPETAVAQGLRWTLFRQISAMSREGKRASWRKQCIHREALLSVWVSCRARPLRFRLQIFGVNGSLQQLGKLAGRLLNLPQGGLGISKHAVSSDLQGEQFTIHSVTRLLIFSFIHLVIHPRTAFEAWVVNR